MAVTQYIGARYVPLFFVNPSDSSNNWKSNYAYDPLTIVTYLTQSYTSKKAVPASVGNPADNPDYWVMTGGYNAQMAELIQEYDTLRNGLDTLNNDVDAIEDKVDALYGRKRTFILLGDSYEYGINGNNTSQQVTGGGWGARCQTMLENMGHTVYRLITPLGGAVGFASARTYLSIIQYLKTNTVTDANAVTDIIVLGGSNDLNYVANVPTAIDNFVAYCRTNFPNARIAIGCLGYRAYSLHANIEAAYKRINSLGGIYISDLTNLMVLTDYLGADNMHLTETGYAFYAPTILNALLTFSADYEYEGTENLTADSGVTAAGSNYKLHYRTKPNDITVWIESDGEDNIGLSSVSVYGGNMNVFSIARTEMFLHPAYKFANDFIYDVSGANVYPKNRCSWTYLSGHIKLYWKSGFSTAAYTAAKAFLPSAAHVQ